VPCFNEEESIGILYEQLCLVSSELKDYDFEILFVNDGSSDNTLNFLKKISTEDQRVIYISFSKNFGKEAAMYAGFVNATGDYVAVMDADMQDPPELLPQMLEYIQNGYDSVATRRASRKGEKPVRSFFARMFYKIINKISDADIVDGARDFRLMKREMVDAIVALGEYNRFSKGIFGWIGFRTYWLSYENVERVAGETKWNFWGLVKYSIEGIINFSQVPLSLASWLGVGFTILSFIMILFIIIRKFLFGDPVAGWASLSCIIIFMGGIQLLCLGIFGCYLSKMYIEEKKRPHYIVAETNGINVNKIH
jgi:glycosyltransferase involved in cell wall biosynthesis